MRRSALVVLVALLFTAVMTSASGATVTTTTKAQALWQHVRVGAFVDTMYSDPTLLTSWEQQVGGHAAVASLFYGFGDVFPGALERTLSDSGRRDVLLSWDMGSGRFTDWSSGKYDSYLDQIGSAAKAFGRSVYLRPWPEMNGDWQAFQPTAAGEKPSGGTYAQFIAAWRHVVDRVRSAGGTNVKWVFNPTADTYAETTPVSKIWPGASYVDVLGMDGYNWGGGVQPWRSFQDIFSTQYTRLTALDSRKPVWVCETSSREPSETDGGLAVDPSRDKGQWITAAFNTTAFPRMTTVVWFDIDKERDWRVASSSSSLTAFRGVMSKLGSTTQTPAALRLRSLRQLVQVRLATRRASLPL